MSVKISLQIDSMTGGDTDLLFPGLHAIDPVSASGENAFGMGFLTYNMFNDTGLKFTHQALFHGVNFHNTAVYGSQDFSGNITSIEFARMNESNTTTKLAHLNIELDAKTSLWGGLPMLSAYSLTPDSLIAHAGSNGAQLTIIGNDGSDRLGGSNYSDVLDGRVGIDIAIGRGGSDFYYIDDSRDYIIEQFVEGIDIVNATASYILSANVENISLKGSGNINATGNTLANTLVGNVGKNMLTGGAGRDTLTGDDGADTFVFRSKADSTVSSGGRDTIMDFSRVEHDRIDLHLIDASTKAGSNQAFTFIGTKAFTKHAGELQAKKVGSDTLISGDLNGDGKADFAILLDTALTMQKGDFIL